MNNLSYEHYYTFNQKSILNTLETMFALFLKLYN
jgi:hypothetical protein